MPSNVLRGAKAIGKALGVSERTVRRWAKAGALEAKKLKPNTSPYVVDRDELDRRRKARGVARA